MPSVITANLLSSGDVAYLTADGDWVWDLEKAAVANDATALQALEALALAAVKRNEVLSVYAMDVRIEGGAPAALSVREKIRAAHAPTV